MRTQLRPLAAPGRDIRQLPGHVAVSTVISTLLCTSLSYFYFTQKYAKTSVPSLRASWEPARVPTGQSLAAELRRRLLQEWTDGEMGG